MLKTIMVPLDGSAFGRQALPLAAALARRTGAMLHLVHVHVPTVNPYAGIPVGALAIPSWDMDAGERKQAQYNLAAAEAQVTSIIPGMVSSVMLDGPIGDSLITYAESINVDLIVMTTHGRGPLVRLWLGSVADSLVRQAAVPVLLLRPHEGMHVPDHDARFRRVLLPLDGSSFAEQAIEPALAIADPEMTTISLLRIIEPYHVSDAVSFRYVVALENEETRERQMEAEAYLAQAAERVRAGGSRVATHAITAEHPAAAVLAAAHDGAYDLIALSTHGRSGLPRLLLGSVADKILRGSECPILVVRPTGRPSESRPTQQ